MKLQKTSSGKKLSSITLYDVYEIGFADGRRGQSKRKTFMLLSWKGKQLKYYDHGYAEGERQRQAAMRREAAL